MTSTQMLLAQSVKVQVLPCKPSSDVYGIAQTTEGLLVTSNYSSAHLVEHKDASGSASPQIYLLPDTNSKQLAEWKKIPQNHLNESCPTVLEPDQSIIICKSIVDNRHNRKFTSLGLFIYKLAHEQWEESAFPFNSTDNTYQLGQPFFDRKTRRLYFVKKETEGQSDIYYSEFKSGIWTAPLELHADINTDQDQFFPYITPSGDLIYSTRADANGDLNLYRAIWNGSEFLHPEIMPTPFNSTSDDVQLIYTNGTDRGYLISNRLDEGHDQLFAFEMERPHFDNCPPSEKPIFCYQFEETTIVPNDSLPMSYEWEFSDGHKSLGLSVKHCFAELGHFKAVLHVYDSTTKMLYANLSELELQIEHNQLPYIHSKTKAEKDSLITFDGSISEMDDFQLLESHWQFGDGHYATGMATTHTYVSPGEYTCELLFIGLKSNGDTLKSCASQTIQIGPFEQNLEADPTTNPYTPTMGSSIIENTARDSALYYVEFTQSEIQLRRNDPYFANIHYEITERHSTSDQLFHYSVGAESNFAATLPILQDLRAQGYTHSLIKDEEQTRFQINKSQNWWFIPDSMESILNKQMNKFNDITFETGSWTISPQSFDELKYIAEVLKTQPKIRLQIIAHTDTVGGITSNQMLSERRAQSVAEHLKELGIGIHQLETKGMGESMSRLSNRRNSKMADDRRVEFRILRPY